MRKGQKRIEWRKPLLPYLRETSEERYSIDREDEILLYGYNLYCKKQADLLLDGEYKAVGIIDKNADGRERYRGIEIVNSIEQFSISKKTCIFIMLQNGMQHWEIARGLYRHGVKRIVFLPMRSDFYSDDIQSEFIIQYNYMLEGAYDLMRVPYLCDEMFRLVWKTWRAAKRLDNGQSIVWVKKELLRTTMKEPEQYRDIPIVGFMPYFNLFFTLAGDKKDISEYIKLYGLTPFPETSVEAHDYVIAKRQSLFDYFEDKFRTGSIDYFVAAAPKAVWNTNGYLNLCEGQHRCVYLLTKGIDYLPVRVDQAVINHLNWE